MAHSSRGTISEARFTGTICGIMAPNFDNVDKKPKFVQVYEQAAWRRDDMALLEFLRKANAKGDIIRYIVEKHKKHLMEEVQQQRGKITTPSQRTVKRCWAPATGTRRRANRTTRSPRLWWNYWRTSTATRT